MRNTPIALLMLTATLTFAEHEDEEVQKDSRGNELPVLMPKHVDPDGHAASHLEVIDFLHAASLLFPDAVIEQLECEFAAEYPKKDRRFRMSSKE